MNDNGTGHVWHYQGIVIKLPITAAPLWPYRRREVTRRTVVRALRMLDRAHDGVMATEEHSPERTAKLCTIEVKRTALANLIGAC